MAEHLVLLSPSANRVFAGKQATLAAAELEICLGLPVTPVRVAGVDYLRFDAEELDTMTVARSSSALALFERVQELLKPIMLPAALLLDDDLVTIPKYPGKTNEQFTRLMVNIAMAQCQTSTKKRRTILDPMCGRGTTLSVAWQLGFDAAGVEADVHAVEAYAAYLKTYLRRKRFKHQAATTPVRREGKRIGDRFDASLASTTDATPIDGPLTCTIFTGDTRQSQALFGKRLFDAVITDAPYGVVHGSHSDVRGPAAGGRDRSAAGLLREAIPGWISQLKPGGVLALSWNTFSMSRDDLGTVLNEHDLAVLDDGPWRQLEHRVDSSINRDIIVAVKPVEGVAA